MSRRIRCLALLLAAAALPAAEAPRPRPAWVKEGIVMVGNWEPLTFLRRRGGQSLEDEENWPLERTEAVARKLQAAGVNLVVTNLHKGFGVKTEASDIEATRRFVEYAHRYGIRVGGYIGASMMYETFFAEEPQASGWKQVDERGQPVFYNHAQPFRYMACRNHPGYGAFLERLMRLGVEDLKLDLIHFDQMESWNEPNVCRCRFCARQFREFLRAKYTDTQLRARFGFARLEGIEPPSTAAFMAAGASVIVDPLAQEWVEFRADSYARRYGEYDRYLHRLNPAVALEGNPNVDPSLNKAVRNAVNLERLLEHGDIVWSEEPQQASWTADGRLISKIRSFKMTRRMGKSLFVYTGGRYGTASPDSPPHLRLAEAMAYNDMNLGMVGDVTPEGVALTAEARRYIDFFLAHKAVLAGARPVADVAVLRSFASIEFNPAETLPPTMLFEQSLIQAKVPFDIISDRHLADLDRYKVLVLANQDALSDAQVLAIRGFVERGGGLVATGNTSMLTEWRLRRRKFGFAGLFGRDLPGEAVRRESGRGRVAYLPGVVPAVTPPAPHINYRFDNRCWKLPRNHAELIAAVDWAARGELSARISALASVAMELTRRPDDGALLLHLVNYDFRHPVEAIDVSLRVPSGTAGAEVSLESPDASAAAAIRATVRDGQVSFRVPRLAVYALAQVRLQK